METNRQPERSEAVNSGVKHIFKKMIADKRVVQSYIRTHGSLKGFADATVRFAKPL